MISWIQKTFQAHFKVMFALLLLAMVVPLVFIYSASSGFGGGDPTSRVFTVFGITLKSDADRLLVADSALSLYLNSGNQYFNDEQARQYSYYRAASLQIAEQLGLPRATKDDVKALIPTRRGFANPQDGKFDPQRYQQALDNIQADPKNDRGQLPRVLADDWRIGQVQQLFGGPGYVLDSELKQMLARVDTTWSLQVATLDLAKVPAAQQPTEDELRRWFDAAPSRYQIAERTRVKYVEFRAEDFATKVELNPGDISDYFEANKARYRLPTPPPAEGQPPATPVDPALVDVRDQVVRDLTRKQGAILASKAANDFAYTLFKNQITPGTEDFEKFVTARGLSLKAPEPFTFSEAPAGTGWSARLLGLASQLDDKRLVSDALPTGATGENSVVLFFVERLPSFVPEFLAARDRVLVDVREDLRQKAVAARGEELRRQFAEAVQKGGSFLDAAKAAGLETKSWEKFTLRAPPADIDYNVAGRLDDLKTGEVSPMASESGRGTFALVISRQVPEVAASGERFDEVRRYVAAQSSQQIAQEIISDKVRKELLAAGIMSEKTGEEN